jgi:hypothetical protein
MEIREHELVLERLPEHVLHEALDPAYVLEDVPVCTADLGFERDRGQQAVGDGEGLGRALRVAMGVVVVVAGSKGRQGWGAGGAFRVGVGGWRG